MDDFKFNSSGTDAVYMANLSIFLTTLFGLDLFRTDWREDKLGSQSFLQGCYESFRQMYEGGLTGNRIHIAGRKSARKDFDVRIKTILSYVAIFAGESDISALLASGVVTRKSTTRARRATKPATTQ